MLSGLFTHSADEGGVAIAILRARKSCSWLEFIFSNNASMKSI